MNILVIFVIILVIADFGKAFPSYLRLIGSYRSNEFTLKRYYLSQRVAYTWLESNILCVANGLRLAHVGDGEELKYLGQIAERFPELFQNDVNVYGFDNKSAAECHVFKAGSIVEITTCDTKKLKFLCQEEMKTSYDDHVDPRATFFTTLADYGDLNLS